MDRTNRSTPDLSQMAARMAWGPGGKQLSADAAKKLELEPLSAADVASLRSILGADVLCNVLPSLLNLCRRYRSLQFACRPARHEPLEIAGFVNAAEALLERWRALSPSDRQSFLVANDSAVSEAAERVIPWLESVVSRKQYRRRPGAPRASGRRTLLVRLALILDRAGVPLAKTRPDREEITKTRRAYFGRTAKVILLAVHERVPADMLRLLKEVIDEARLYSSLSGD